ncbi:hypothetical protein AYI70_g12289 [Smittium culicis]|uniref:Uncharacterized protein n=1 Tax=Smittium culicis TaxID=133412 RepID=A0A1R1WY51_9FUNG|nr:hypothetical protein AYI70_g12289 [Smittium culicis]
MKPMSFDVYRSKPQLLERGSFKSTISNRSQVINASQPGVSGKLEVYNIPREALKIVELSSRMLADHSIITYHSRISDPNNFA